MQVAVAAESVKNTAETDVKQSQFVCDTETGQKHDAVSILPDPNGPKKIHH